MAGDINITGGTVNGGFAFGSGSQATGAGGSIFGANPHALQTLLAEIRKQAEGMPPTARQSVLETVAGVEVEAAREGPNSSRVRTLLSSLRAVAEGTVSSVIATYLSGS